MSGKPWIGLSLILSLVGVAALLRVNASAHIEETTAASQQNETTRDPSTIIHPALQRAIQENPNSDSFDVIIEWQRDDSSISALGAEITGESKSTRRKQLVSQLASETERQAAVLLSQLDQAEQRGSAKNVRSYWVSPIISLSASPSLIEEMARWDRVVQIRLDEKLTLQDTGFQLDESGLNTGDPYNLTMIKALQTEQSLGLDGNGVVVASLDTGVDWQHPALLTKYRGFNPKGPSVHAGNWYVVTNEPYIYPGDGYGHGTHTTGSILGDDGAGNRIGVARGAKWIAVKLFTNEGYTYESWTHAAFQWILAPDGDPSLAPDIINNSWGSDAGSDSRYRSDLAAIRAAGILPIFSGGNNGPDSGTISSPGSYPEVLAVGAVDPYKTVASFSARGPSPWHEIKPEVMAPGVQIRSAFPGGGYAYSDGTSMAAPHVSGVAALLLQANPNLSPDELEAIIKNTAEPLETITPNNNSGWGLIDAYAASLKATSQGELSGKVVRTNGEGITNASVTAIRRDEAITITASSTPSGEYSMALPPGLYDVTGAAFGYDSKTIPAITIITDSQTHANITLTAQPVGEVYGWITDEISGEPLSATISVIDTPVKTQSNPVSGAYSLSLPAGDWNIRINADSHRLGHITPTVTAGNSVQIDVALKPGPNILLVDSGPWYYGSQIEYYEDALEALDYPYSLWSIRQFTPDDYRPTSGTLSSYDVVLWSSPQDSPGYIDAGDVISDYLAGGGRFLISGQDVAYWDAGGSPFPGIQTYLYDFMSIHFLDEGHLGELNGEGALFPLTLTVNTSDSAGQQTTPDSVVISNPILTQSAFRWSDQSIAGVTAGRCTPYKAAWLGFGLEGVGPRPARLSTLQKILDWFDTPPEAYGLQFKTIPQILIGNPGSQVSQTLQLFTTGVQTDTYHIDLLDGDWPSHFSLPDGSQFSSHTDITLPGCSVTTITATITLPVPLLRNTIENFPVSVSSDSDPLISQTVTLTAKSPAPVLVVDDERWYDYQYRYTETLETLGIPFDIVNTGGNTGPSSTTLESYPVTLWTTGYDWYLPLSSSDETNLAAYLDQGGRLLLSSQDLLDVKGVDSFIQNRLGVEKAHITITSTEVMALPNNPLNIQPIPWALEFPYKNWSDGITPKIGSSAVLQDQQQFNVGLIHPDTNWRTAFYSFPLETLDSEALRTLINQNLLWLSPFGDSRLETPKAAAEGAQFPITLTLGLAASEPKTGLSAVLPLLPETSLVSGSLSGPWNFNPVSNTLTWNGDLSPSAPVTMTAMLKLSTGIPDGTILPLSAQFYDDQGLVIANEAPVQVDVPWLWLDKQVNRTEATLGSDLFYTITFTNSGVINASTLLTETISSGLTVAPGDITCTVGSITANSAGFTWQGDIPANQQVIIYYKGSINLIRPGGALTTRTDLTYPFGRRSAWASVVVPAKIYIPGAWNQ